MCHCDSATHVDRLLKKQRSAYKKTENLNEHIKTAVKDECEKYNSNADAVITSKRSLCSNLIRKRAFTLAEVLITLGIIGVVAALTIPTLIADYQKKVWVAQLQKSVNILENGFLKMKADAGVDKLSETGMWNIESFPKYFKIINDNYMNNIGHRWKGLYELSNSTMDVVGMYYILADGMLLYFDLQPVANTLTPERCKQVKSQGGNMCSNVGEIYIDVNGFKKPNQMGRDVFRFVISDEGHLYPKFGMDEALYMFEPSLYWRNYSKVCGVPDEPINLKIYPNGYGCAARIIENGWKMDY